MVYMIDGGAWTAANRAHRLTRMHARAHTRSRNTLMRRGTVLLLLNPKIANEAFYHSTNIHFLYLINKPVNE